jgi:hypothetical protein
MSKAKYMKFGLVQDVKMPADFVWKFLVCAYSEMNLSCVCKQINLSLLHKASAEPLVLIQLGEVPSQGHNIQYSALEVRGQNQYLSVDSRITVILHMPGMF